jgi:hypothetical protein
MTSSGWIRQTATQMNTQPDTQQNRQMNRRAFLKTLALASSAALVDWTGMGALADSVKNKTDFPVVIIGSGLGGLVCGAYLARSGFDVTLLEQHSIPGGYATSFDRGDFTFDVSLHATVAEHAMPQMILEDLGVWKDLDVAYSPELRRIITDRFDITLPAKDPEGVKARLSKQFPHEEKGIHEFFTQMEQVISALWGRGPSHGGIMEQLEALTLSQWMDLHVSDPDVKSCMAVFAPYYGLPPEELNALFYAIATGEYLVLGGQYYKARSQDLSSTLAQGIQNFGGRIHYNTRAEQILFAPDNTITGVKDHKEGVSGQSRDRQLPGAGPGERPGAAGGPAGIICGTGPAAPAFPVQFCGVAGTQPARVRYHGLRNRPGRNGRRARKPSVQYRRPGGIRHRHHPLRQPVQGIFR